MFFFFPDHAILEILLHAILRDTAFVARRIHAEPDAVNFSDLFIV